MSNRHREIISKEPCTPLCCSMGEPEALSGSPPWGWAVPFRFNTIESHQLCKILWSPLVFSRCANGTSLKGWRSGQVAEHLPRMHWVRRPPSPSTHSYVIEQEESQYELSVSLRVLQSNRRILTRSNFKKSRKVKL